MHRKWVGVFIVIFLVGVVAVVGRYATNMSDNDSSGKGMGSIVPTTTPNPMPLPTSFISVPSDNTLLIDMVQTWLAKNPAIPITILRPNDAPVFVQSGFPIMPPLATAINLEDYYNGYVVEIWAVVIPADKSFIAINYRYKEQVGGGQSAYAEFYGWDLDYHVAVIYEIVDPTYWSEEVIQQAISGFQIDNGAFVVRTDGSVIPLESIRYLANN